MRGLVIRPYREGYFLCDGKPPLGHKDDGESYIGSTVNWYLTWDAANKARSVANAAYGYIPDVNDKEYIPPTPTPNSEQWPKNVRKYLFTEE